MANKINLDLMTTEKRNLSTMNLDTMTPLEIVTAMNNEDKKVPLAITPLLPKIAKVVQLAVASLTNNGRIIYIGAGTSGRLGVLDAVECPPTFGVSHDLVVGLIAGGEKAFVKAVEGAEDSLVLAKEDLININLNKNDLVIGIAASGRTPYVIGGLDYAKEIGCHTAAITCNDGSSVGKCAEIAIEAIVGPEVLTGSTRLKAGTAQKLILNMISTATMVQIGKAYENLMVDVMQTNDKLHARAEKIIVEATGVEPEIAKTTLLEAEGSVKLAITMILGNFSKDEAKSRLISASGHVREAIKNKI